MIKSLFRFDREDIPVVALAIHHGHELPPELEENCGISPAERLREEDPYTGLIAAEYPNHIVVQTSRFAIDLNRGEDKCIYLQPEDCWGLEVRKTRLDGVLVHKLRESYRDWYAVVAFHIDRMLARHSHLVIFDLHSYNHRRRGTGHPPEPPKDNPDINLGSSNMPQEYRSYLSRLQDLLTDIAMKRVPTDGIAHGSKLDCRIDIKFTGGHLSRWLHHSYPYQVIAVAVEFKKFFMDEWTGILDGSCFQFLSRGMSVQSGLWADEMIGLLKRGIG